MGGGGGGGLRGGGGICSDSDEYVNELVSSLLWSSLLALLA